MRINSISIRLPIEARKWNKSIESVSWAQWLIESWKEKTNKQKHQHTFIITWFYNEWQWIESSICRPDNLSLVLYSYTYTNMYTRIWSTDRSIQMYTSLRFSSVQYIPVRCSLLARTPVILHLIWCIHIYSHMNSYVFSPYRLVNSESICKYNI